MRIFTQEQVKDLLEDINNLSDEGQFYYMTNMTPIELPSDEEIWEKIEDSAYSLEYDTGFAQGAKWVIEKIKEQATT